MPKTKINSQPSTTAQQLASLIKSARDIMRKDKGLSGDLDRLPMLTWIMFLKFLDDMEQIEESRAKLRKERYRSSIEPTYRWRDWAANETGITGPELIAFIQHEECRRPDGSKGQGLFAYLRGLGNGNGKSTAVSRRRVIAAVFAGVQNRMTSGYLLRDVINKVTGIHFLAKDELFTLGHLYESMLKEMRDAAGDNGEFYTPRPVVRFMVDVLNPQLGETILDPACGTGGFLVETYAHLEKQCKTVEHRKLLQYESIFGGEAKPLPFLLCQMNLLLHGLEAPNIDPENSLRHKLSEMGDRDRVDVILTNPPFGGEEETGIKANFPEDKQTSETALLFLQLIMRKLRRVPKPGRAAVVVPNGVLSAPGIATRIRQALLGEFNVWAIVRLPHNVFAPYTDIRTNILFFDRTGASRRILYCEPPIPEGYSLSKTKPLLYEWLIPFAQLILDHKASDDAWIVDISTLDGSVNLDIKNPRLSLNRLESAPTIFRSLASTFDALHAEVARLGSESEKLITMLRGAPRRLLGDLTQESDQRIGRAYSTDVRLLGVSSEEGFCKPKAAVGSQPQRYKVVGVGYLAYNPMRINIGSIGVAVSQLQTGITSPDYVVFFCKNGLLPEYVYHYLRSEDGRHEIGQKTKGSVRFRLYYDQLARIAIPVPDDIELQRRFAALCSAIEGIRKKGGAAVNDIENALDAIRRDAFLGLARDVAATSVGA